jgi:hypothetical protein
MPLVCYHHRKNPCTKQPVKQQGGQSTAFDAWLKRRNNVVKHTELQHIRERFSKIKWVLLKLPQEPTRLIDVGEWMHRHPGGDVFSSKLYTDISKQFLDIPYHYDTNGKFHDSVYNTVQLCTKAFVRHDR